jgi:hypothetical protein
MAGKRVAVVDADGQFGTIDEEYAHEIEASGGRILSSKEQAQRAVDERYDALPTAQKVLGAVNTVAGGLIGGPVAFGGDPNAPPDIAAYGSGVREGATAGLYDAGMRKLVESPLTTALGEALGSTAQTGKAAGDTYALRRDQENEASPLGTGAGKLVGMAAGAALGTKGAGLARALPTAALSTAGDLVETGLGRALGDLAARGAVGRAAATGLGMGVRGALEGAAYSGLEQEGQNILHDTPETGEKLYAALGHGALAGGGLGAALGFSGSLVASGARELASAAGSASSGVGKSLSRVLTDPDNAARGLAQEQAWDTVGRGFGLQSTRYAKQVERAGGKPALGEIGLRYNLIDTGAATDSPLVAGLKAARSGTPADVVPKAEIALEQVGRQLGDITNASGARVTRDQVASVIDSVAKEYESAAATRPIGRSIRSFGDELVDSLGLQTPGSTASIQDAIRERKAIDQLAFADAPTLDPKTALKAKRELRWGLEDLITDSLDNASGKVPGQLRDQYNSLKKDYAGLSLWLDAAEDSAARASKASLFGLKEAWAGGTALASGHLLAAPVLAVGGKVIKERGNAALAGFMSRVADQGTLGKIVQQFNQRVSKSAAGVLQAPSSASPTLARRLARGASVAAAKASPEQNRAQIDETQKKATNVVKWVGQMRANPQQVMDQLQDAASLVGQSAGPKAAESYTASTLRAINFIAGYVPVKERRDPLDPRSVPPLTFDEADRLLRAARYATKPETIFDDFEHGKVTPEGLKAAQTFAPTAFSEFQTQLQEHVENHMLHNRQLTDSQRLRIDKLLGYPAGADLKPAAIARLQSNLMKAPPEPPPADPNGGAPSPPPVDMKVQQTGFDAVEARASAG